MTPAQMVQEFYDSFTDPERDSRMYSEAIKHRKMIQEEHEELMLHLPNGSRLVIARELADNVYVHYGAARFYRIDLDEAIRIVHAANMSKLVDGKPIFRPTDGKVCKGPNFVPPDLTKALR